MSPYRYSPVNSGNQEIRLLIIEPAMGYNDAMICTLFTTQISRAPPFGALSYVWGDANLKHPISLDGEISYATSNLLSALKQLRSTTSTVVCWVDALCINQKDNAEKSGQILLMGSVYKAAFAVWIWLGDEAENSALACDLITRWGDAAYHFIVGHGRSPQSMEEFGAIYEAVGPGALDEEAWKALDALLRRPWWTRIWVVQEFALNTRRVFWCGNSAFNGTHLITAMLAWGGTELWPGFHTFTQAHPDAMYIFRHFQSGRLALFQEVFTLKGEASPVAALSLLCRTQHFFSTDPRDKLYGLLGLFNSAQLKIIPNYELSKAEVYLGLVGQYLAATGNLQILALSGLCRGNPGKSCTLPSWVPHLDCGFDAPAGWETHTQARSGHSALHTKIIKDSRILVTRGVFCGRINHIFFYHRQIDPDETNDRIYHWSQPPIQGHVASVRDVIKGYLEFRSKCYRKNDIKESTPLQALFSVLVQRNSRDTDMVPHVQGFYGALHFVANDYTPESWAETLFGAGVTTYLNQPLNDAFWGQKGAPEKHSESDKAEENHIFLIADAVRVGLDKCRGLFFDEFGNLGIGRQSLRPDDRIFVPFGCNVPLIVRSVSDKYEIVGSCILPALDVSFMDQALVDVDRVVELKII